MIHRGSRPLQSTIHAFNLIFTAMAHAAQNSAEIQRKGLKCTTSYPTYDVCMSFQTALKQLKINICVKRAIYKEI